ncbi:uncharacterized protein LOC135841215 [Planococcus citri]|uniref:uncharacterized protein LOC135841215 n=1 Tax=Planococcus citri TaxID=170843 RepID=UPI0031F7DE88
MDGGSDRNGQDERNKKTEPEDTKKSKDVNNGNASRDLSLASISGLVPINETLSSEENIGISSNVVTDRPSDGAQLPENVLRFDAEVLHNPSNASPNHNETSSSEENFEDSIGDLADLSSDDAQSPKKEIQTVVDVHHDPSNASPNHTIQSPSSLPSTSTPARAPAKLAVLSSESKKYTDLRNTLRKSCPNLSSEAHEEKNGSPKQTSASNAASKTPPIKTTADKSKQTSTDNNSGAGDKQERKAAADNNPSNDINRIDVVDVNVQQAEVHGNSETVSPDRTIQSLSPLPFWSALACVLTRQQVERNRELKKARHLANEVRKTRFNFYKLLQDNNDSGGCCKNFSLKYEVYIYFLAWIIIYFVAFQFPSVRDLPWVLQQDSDDFPKFEFNLNRTEYITIKENNTFRDTRFDNSSGLLNQHYAHEYCQRGLRNLFVNINNCQRNETKAKNNFHHPTQTPGIIEYTKPTVIEDYKFYNELKKIAGDYVKNKTGIGYDNLYDLCVRIFETNPFGDVEVVISEVKAGRKPPNVTRKFVYRNIVLMKKCRLLPAVQSRTFYRDETPTFFNDSERLLKYVAQVSGVSLGCLILRFIICTICCTCCTNEPTQRCDGYDSDNSASESYPMLSKYTSSPTVTSNSNLVANVNERANGEDSAQRSSHQRSSAQLESPTKFIETEC